jgi:hypothetical protein
LYPAGLAGRGAVSNTRRRGIVESKLKGMAVRFNTVRAINKFPLELSLNLLPPPEKKVLN